LLPGFDEALASYDHALALKPDYFDALNNRGVTLHELRRFPEALASYDRALALRPDHAGALNNRGMPLWLGQTAIEDKTILPHAEQRFGDTIQFMRRWSPDAARACCSKCQCSSRTLRRAWRTCRDHC
jgi:tetratricopeptide (TPR) repeat protein